MDEARVPLVYSDEVDQRQRLQRAVSRGELVRVARGIYSSDVHAPVEVIVRRHIWSILAREFPRAVISDLSVEDGGTGSHGVVHVVSSRKRHLALPGIRIVPRPGSGPVAGDTPLPDGLWLAGEPRALLDNLVPSRARTDTGRRTGGAAWVELRVDRWCSQHGQDSLNDLRDQARSIAEPLDRITQWRQLDAIIGAALSTPPSTVWTTSALQGRSTGSPVDQSRVALFHRLVGALTDIAPSPLPDLPTDSGRRQLLPFYDAYFSNYIEGTEFTLDEAAAIVFDGEVPAGRPADAHDVSGTYQLTSSASHMTTVPRSGAELIDLLRIRHEVLMAGRPDVGPGLFKVRANRAGTTEFVPPDLVEGTLHQGFEAASGLVDPFSRAVFMMFLVSEVHPFTDGNGRTARIFMNAELVAAGQVRIVIPTVYGANYLAALKAASHTAGDQALIAVLQFAQRWTARVDWTSRATAEADLEQANALRDAREAEDAGIRLRFPG